MNPAQLSAAVVDALASLVDSGALVLPDGVPTEVTIERPRQKGHGDYATNVAMQLAKKAGTNPRALGELLAAELLRADGIAAVEVAGPGFLNVSVEAGAQGAVAAAVVAAGAAYGRNDAQAGERIDVEFISANPTGPLHLGHTRWAVVGDAVARVLEAAGARVTREFYINDRGNQMNLFGASIEARAFGEPVPDDGYHGDYVADLAQQILTDRPELRDLPPGAERTAAFREAGYALQLADQQEQLRRFHTVFDVWFSERSLHESNDVAAGLEKLRSRGTCTTPTGRCGCARPTTATTVTGCSCAATASSPTSRVTRPTTSTSASAASTAASTCSGPTTTATSDGSRRWRRARVTTPSATSRC